MAHWRSRQPPAPSGLALAVWWALGQALAVPVLLLGLKLLNSR